MPATPDRLPLPSQQPPRLVQQHHVDTQAEREAAWQALRAPHASVAPKWFYDRLGSMLFEAITQLPEYTATRDEAVIFAQHGAAIAAACGQPGTLVDLGAGNCAKASAWMRRLRPRRYLAVDVSVDFLRDALLRVQQQHPGLEVIGLGLDLAGDLGIPGELVDGPPLFFYPGSSIGNFTPPQALQFLRRVRTAAAGGGLLIGVDLVKPAAELEAAYDDAVGVTAAFNLNLLRHLNAALGTDFDPRQWRHVAQYDRTAQRIEMWLEALAELTVRGPGGERGFKRGERILTEYSCKFEPEQFAALLHEAGFVDTRCWTDGPSPARRFAVFHARAPGTAAAAA